MRALYEIRRIEIGNPYNPSYRYELYNRYLLGIVATAWSERRTAPLWMRKRQRELNSKFSASVEISHEVRT